MMNEEKVNMEIRRFLKKVGVTSQREIERVIREGQTGQREIAVKMTLNVAGSDLHTIEDTISLE